MIKPTISLLVTAVCIISIGQQLPPTQPSVFPQRAERVEALRKEIRIDNRDAERRVTKQYSESRLMQLRDIVKDQILETLAKNDSAEGVLQVLRTLLGLSRVHPGDCWECVFAFRFKLQDQQVLIIGYNVLHGGVGIPNSRVVIQAYKKSGSEYELVAETGDTLEGCGLNLDYLHSPLLDQAWFLAHGHVYGYMGHKEMIRLVWL